MPGLRACAVARPLGLDLDAAAGLLAIAPVDAPTELAHGHLEALQETVTETWAHPERLGGLATQAPADLAHANDCASCGRALVLLRRGAAELLALFPAAPGRGPLPRWVLVLVALVGVIALALAVPALIEIGR